MNKRYGAKQDCILRQQHVRKIGRFPVTLRKKQDEAEHSKA